MTKKDTTKHDLQSSLVDTVYAGSLNPALYDQVFKTWDEQFEASLKTNALNHMSGFDWAEAFIAHFDRAGELLDHIQPEHRKSIIDEISHMPYAGILSTLDGVIIKSNRHAREYIQDTPYETIFDLPLSDHSKQTLKAIVSQDLRVGSSNILRYELSEHTAPLVLTCDIIQDKDAFSPTDNHLGLLLRAVHAVWTERVERTLMDTFDLSRAEIDLLHHLYKGLSISETVAQTGKSQPTLRSQLSSILHKTGTKSQSALARLTVSVVQTIADKPAINSDPLAKKAPSAALQERQTIALSNGLSVEVVKSGAMNGRVFYFISQVCSPFLSPEIVEALAKNNICLIAPFKSGSGQTTKTPSSFGLEDWADMHLEVLHKLGYDNFVCGGYTPGGIYALEIAKRAKEKCRAVLLAASGAPITSMRQIYAMTGPAKRLVLAARYTPRLLFTPIKFIAADFKASEAGKNRACRYYLKESATDEKMLENPQLLELFKENIAYSFENVQQVTQDYIYWAQDQTELFEAVAQTCPIHFFHGGDDKLMRPEFIQSFIETRNNMTLRTVDGHGHLIMYTAPALFAEDIARLCALIPT